MEIYLDSSLSAGTLLDSLALGKMLAVLEPGCATFLRAPHSVGGFGNAVGTQIRDE